MWEDNPLQLEQAHPRVRRVVVAANDDHLVRSPNPFADGLFLKSNNGLTSFTMLQFYVNLDETEFMHLTRLTFLDLFLLKKLGVKNVQLRGREQN